MIIKQDNIKIDLNNMVLPELMTVQAKPIIINLSNGKYLLFEIPSTDKYFDFESNYLSILTTYFKLFSGVDFLEYKDFEKISNVKKFLKQTKIALQNKLVIQDITKIVDKYFKANFNIKKLSKFTNPIEFAMIFTLIHKVVEFVKKKFLETANEMIPKEVLTSAISSTSMNTNSGKIVPRF